MSAIDRAREEGRRVGLLEAVEVLKAEWNATSRECRTREVEVYSANVAIAVYNAAYEAVHKVLSQAGAS